jgi:sortase (surface protein transpeptidase)
VAPANAISIAGRVIPIVDVADTAVDAGDHVNKYGAKFLYGHNTSAVFGNLTSVGVGNVFTVAYGGTSRNYQVQEVQIFEKTSPKQLSASGRDYRMSYIANGMGRYDIVLMTCYGTMLGGGDATHRYVVFANAI